MSEQGVSFAPTVGEKVAADLKGAAEEPRVPQPGDVVVYHDEGGVPFNALVTDVHGPVCVNVTHVTGNPDERDPYGRQIKRVSSVTHKSMGQAHGRYFRWPEESPNPYKPPMSR